MYKHPFTTSFSLASAFLLVGCAVGPDYRAPMVVPPTQFSQAGYEAFSAANVDMEWWKNFDDAPLTELVHEALRQNHDLRIASARLAEARGTRSETHWAFAPSGGATGRFQRSQINEVESGVAGTAPLQFWSGGLDAAWELDLFGRLRRSAEAAAAKVAVSDADYRAVKVALLAEVAANYFGLRGTEAALALVRGQVELLQFGLNITQSRLDAGRGTPLDTARAESLLHETAALLPGFEGDVTAYRHRLAVLIGRQPEAFSLPSVSTQGTSTLPRVVGIASPADLLRRRPDVVRADRELAAATARIGVSTAALFPNVSIGGLFRFVGLELGDIGDAGSNSWSVSPAVRWSILDLGGLHARLEASRARSDGALAIYERSILLALEDTENALARYRAALTRTLSLDARRVASERARELAQLQHEAGVADPLTILDAERTALAAARDSIAARTGERLALVSLYKALGGGWEAQDSL